MQEGEIQLESLVKSFGDVVAVDGIDVHMPPGEFFTMVGPSGCGKTTTLRMIAGFERPTSGRIMLDGVDVAQTPPHRRNVNTVFQSYALFPHLNVADNVAFGLKYKKVSKGDRAKMVGEALSLVQLDRLREAQAGPALGRPAAARRAGARARAAPARAAARRAARSARRPPAQGPAGRAEDAAADPRHHVRVRHARSGRGAHHERPRGGHERRPRRAERPAAGDVRGAGDALRGRLPGRLEPRARRGRRAATEGRAGSRVGDVSLRAAAGHRSTPPGSVKAMIRPERVRIEPQGSEGENRLPGLVEHLVFLGSFREVRVRLLGGALVTAVQPNDGDGAGLRAGLVGLRAPARRSRCACSPTGLRAGRTVDEEAGRGRRDRRRGAAAPSSLRTRTRHRPDRGACGRRRDAWPIPPASPTCAARSRSSRAAPTASAPPAPSCWRPPARTSSCSTARRPALPAGAEAIAARRHRRARDRRGHGATWPERHGRLDVLVASAGIAIRRPATELSLADWQAVVDVNLTGVFLCARSAARHMIAAGGGRIVTIASVLGVVGGGVYPNISYQAAKGGVINLTRALALEWATTGSASTRSLRRTCARASTAGLVADAGAAAASSSSARRSAVSQSPRRWPTPSLVPGRPRLGDGHRPRARGRRRLPGAVASAP